MNIYHWIALLFVADLALILFVRGADERRQDSQKRKTEWRRA
ncbi:hypothetical protein [Paraburkholderia panacisoli]|nr:hypothetical protein [Paraburkholderia panacisoli]